MSAVAEAQAALGTTFSDGGYRYVIERLVPDVLLRCFDEDGSGVVSEVTRDQLHEAMKAARERVEEIKKLGGVR